ncbi:unnamed protein product [Rotaria sp. Silwood2]|nr:unnamed protein product [Rotaria sp. Silwood2]CAF2972599.1 unnamed protein product [Rotaria sp. Silwood2]CAF4219089.1 unnamed protein product [Rotaria sp. Silwood2]CAF4234203.1 unnamed protein product [Rotaria sp. Silwood2]CAF4259238.1 unnamed protein product [Rotaria sp. Silwood2]
MVPTSFNRHKELDNDEDYIIYPEGIIDFRPYRTVARYRKAMGASTNFSLKPFPVSEDSTETLLLGLEDLAHQHAYPGFNFDYRKLGLPEEEARENYPYYSPLGWYCHELNVLDNLVLQCQVQPSKFTTHTSLASVGEACRIVDPSAIQPYGILLKKVDSTEQERED